MAKSYHDEISTSWILDLIIKPSVVTKYVVLYTAASTKHVQGCGHTKKKRLVLYKLVTPTLGI